MSKQAIKKLNAKHESYDLTVETTTVTEVGEDKKAFSKPAIKVIITVFQHGEKGAVILKKSAAYGVGDTTAAAQSNAIESAVEGLGL